MQDCPILIDKKGKATLNYVEVLPSSSNPTSSSESDPVVPLKVITRAQAQAKNLQKENEIETAPSERSNKTKRSWKACRERRAASKKKQEQSTAAEKNKSKQKETELNQNKEKERENLKPKERIEQSSGSVLAEKHFEPLDALLQAYEARLKPLETLEERWRKYPDPAVEARQLEIYQRLIEATQALDQQIKRTSSLHTEPQKEELETEKETHTKEGEQMESLGKEK